MITAGKYILAEKFQLLREPEEYSVGEILELMEGTLSSVACLADPNYICTRENICQTLPMWREYDKLVRDFFYNKKLSDLLSYPDGRPSDYII